VGLRSPFIQRIQDASDTPFDNSTNGFASTDTQAAIEEIKLRIKAGVVTAGSFAGDPKKYAVAFASAFADANYAINITGIDARSWTYESKVAGGFTINTNANKVLSAEVSWECIRVGE
jgi:hypothetical protein